MKMQNENREFIRWLEKQNTKTSKRVLKALDRDILVLWSDGRHGDLYAEQVSEIHPIPDYVYEMAKRYGKATNRRVW